MAETLQIRGSFLANGIGAEGLAIFGCVYFVLPALVVITIEWATIHAIVRRQRAWPTGAVVAANFWSLLAGVPVMILFARNFDRLVPSDLHLYFPAYLRFSLLKYAAYFAVTVVAELAYVMWLARRERAWSPARLAGAVLLANALTYAVLCPAHYFGMRPTHDVQTFTADTSWAPPGLGPIIYIDHPTKSLMRIDADGANRTTLIDEPMDGFLLTRDLKACLYVHEAKLHYQRIGRPESRRVLDGRVHASRQVPLGIADISPGGDRIAYLSIHGDGDGSDRELILVDRRLDRAVSVGVIRREFGHETAEVIWSGEERSFAVIIDGQDDWLVRVRGDLTFDITKSDATPMPMPSPVGNYASHGDGYHEIARSNMQNEAEDHQGDLYAAVFSVLANDVVVVTRGKPWHESGKGLIRISDNPGILFLSSHRDFADIRFLPDSRLALLSDETFNALYLVDADARRVGKITAGARFILPIAEYEKTTEEMRIDRATRRH